ncbi:MAG: InlB B-repeat-containing protein [Eubacterium sp.]
MRRESAWRKGLNRLLILVLAVAVILSFSFLSVAFAADSTGGGTGQKIDPYDIANYVKGDPQSKAYSSTEQWTPRVDVVKSLVVDGKEYTPVEGKDYVRTYAFTTQRIGLDGLDLHYSSTTDGMMGPGFIWEKVTGIGDYHGSKEVRHNITSQLNFIPKDLVKYEGEIDPDITYSTFYNHGAPNDFNGCKVTWAREPGETAGVYKIKGVISPTKATTTPDLTIINDNVVKDGYTYSYIVGDHTNGYVFAIAWNGTLTIKKKSHLIYNSNTGSDDEKTLTSENAWKPGEKSEVLKTAKDLGFQKDGYTFTGWNTKKDGTGTSYTAGKDTYDFTNDDDQKDVTLYAQWKENPTPVTPVTPVTNHTVTFHPANGQSDFSQTVSDGNKVSQPADPTQEGYTFNGWYTDSTLTNQYDFDSPVNKDIDLYAKWTKNTPAPNPVSNKVTGILLPKVIANGSSKQTLTWTALKNVDGYFVYAAECNTPNPLKIHHLKKIADVSASSPRVYKRTGLKKGVAYKYRVAAYKITDGKKKIVKRSVDVHSAAGNLLRKKSGRRYTNVKSVQVRKNAVTLKVGKTYRIQPSVKGVYSGCAILQKDHAPMYRYLYIKDGKNISVSQNGLVKAQKAGKCNVYVLGTNGVRTKLAVTVVK